MTNESTEPLPWVWDQTVGSVLDRTAAQFPDHDALVFPALQISLVLARAEPSE